MLTTDAVGGVWHYTLQLAAGMVGAGTGVAVVTLGPRPAPAQRAAATAAGLDLVETDLPLDWTAASPGDVGYAADWLAGFATETGAEIAHLHAPALAGFAWPVPVVAVAHSCVGTWWHAVRCGALPPSLQWRLEQTRLGLQAAACTLAPSHSFAAALRMVYGTALSIQVIHNGGDGCANARAGRPGPVLCAGRLWDEGKNMRVLDSAARDIAAPVEAAGPASGPEGVAFCPRHMRLLGTLDEAGMARQRERAGVFAAPSMYEPFGLAVLEAAASALPLVLADIPTFRELWADAAVFVPPRSPGGWAYAINGLLADQRLRAQLGAAAAQRAARYSRNAMLTRTQAVHRQVLAATRTAA